MSSFLRIQNRIVISITLSACVYAQIPHAGKNTLTIRGQEHTIVEAINRQLTHYSYHIGQIVLLAKHFRSADWKTLSIPKSRSAEFNQFLTEKQSAGEPLGNRLEAPAEFVERDEK